MSAPSNLNASLRKTISVLFILALLGVFLSLYFFKYIPQRQSDFHSRAFGELHQINEAFEERDAAYRQAIRSFLEGAHRNFLKEAPRAFNRSALRSMFIFTSYPERITDDSLSHRKNSYQVAPPTITPASLEGHLLNYPVIAAKTPGGNAVDTVLELSKSLDSVLNSVIPVHKDIFDDYLLIQDDHMDLPSTQSKDHLHEGRIIYNSGELSMDRYVNTDTLLKKSDGFSLLNVHDIKIEGNDYKLFLCPFSNYSQNLILAGLISRSHYTQAYASIPVNMLTAAGIWLLIFLSSLPFLKIYIIGANERVTRWDLRMIIGSYFIVAFVLIILFSRNFLDRVQSTRNRSDLNKLTSQIQDSLSAEIRDICTQLRRYDAIAYSKNATYVNKVKILKLLQDSSLDILDKEPGTEDTLKEVLTPEFYPNLDNLFWIDSSGQWLARWGFRRDLSRMPLIHVEDRQYFKDARNDDWDSLQDPYPKDSFCIQPTLGKLDGVYTITVVIKSLARQLNDSSGRKDTLPIMLGLSAKMYALCNPILPPSYHFSIINDEGQVQFDSEPGRGLQSNLYSETPSATELRRSALNGHEEFFADFTLRGKKVAMLARHLPGLPYTILTYHDLSEDKAFQSHTIGLCILFMAGILALLFLSALCNEWSMAKTGFLKIPPINFEWLRPVPEKYEYYLHLRRGMLGFFGIYLLIWFSIEYFFKKAEFALLPISLLLPFYITLHYYLLREKQKMHIKQLPERTLPAAFFCVAFVLTGINVYLLCSYLDSLTIWLILLAQIFFAGILLFSDAKFKGNKSPSSQSEIIQSELIRHYTRAILTGVLMISVVPAIGMFSLFYKEETKAVLRQQEMYMSRVVKERKNSIHKRSKDYSFNPGKLPHTDSLQELAFQKGIYTLGKLLIDTSVVSTSDNYFIPPYNRLRHLVFSSYDSTVFWGEKAKKQADEPKTAYKTAINSGNPRLIQASLPPPDLQNALDLAMQDILSLDNRYTILLCLAMILVLLLASWLTRSLAKRIFLVEMLDKYYLNNAENKDKFRPKDTGEINDLADQLLKSAGAPALKKTRGEIVLDRSQLEKLQAYENKKEENILIAQTKMKEVYKNLWAKLLPGERLLLYNFATDGLINYQAGMLLYNLLQKRIFFVDEKYQLHIMTDSFRNFVLNQSENKEIVGLMAKSRKEGSWQSFRIPLLLGLGGLGLFLFFTQDDLYQKITGLMTSLITLRPLLSPFLGKGKGQNDKESGGT
ncbi:MAG TPA: cache domain-containing protein [Puia sp.]|nr:cache domain-containing protein [Puia sp.]